MDLAFDYNDEIESLFYENNKIEEPTVAPTDENQDEEILGWGQ